MPSRLEQAQEYYRAGDEKKAVDLLWEVRLADDNVADAQALLDLATVLHAKVEGKLKSDCDYQIGRAKEVLGVADKVSGAPGKGFRTYWQLTPRERFRRELVVSPIVCGGIVVWVLVFNRPLDLADFAWVAFAFLWCGGLLLYNYIRAKSDRASEQDDT